MASLLLLNSCRFACRLAASRVTTAPGSSKRSRPAAIASTAVICRRGLDLGIVAVGHDRVIVMVVCPVVR